MDTPEQPSSSCRVRPWLGTFVEIRVAECGPRAVRAIEAGFAAVALVHERMSPREITSDLARLRAASRGELMEVHPWTWEVLSVAQLFAAWSRGEFDPTVTRKKRRASNWSHLEMLAANRVSIIRAVPALDLGGIAKGFAVDRAIDAIRACGIDAGQVNAGGDLRAFGPLAQPLLIRNPQDSARVYHLGVIQNSAVATSSNALDPAGSGRIIRPGGRRLWIGRGSISVRAASCMIADALCKVVAAVGPVAAQSLLEMCDASAMVLARGEMISVGEFNRAA